MPKSLTAATRNSKGEVPLAARARAALVEVVGARGLDLDDLAARAGLPKTRVAAAIDGRRRLTLKDLSDIAFACGARLELELHEAPRQARRSRAEDVAHG